MQAQLSDLGERQRETSLSYGKHKRHHNLQGWCLLHGAQKLAQSLLGLSLLSPL